MKNDNIGITSESWPNGPCELPLKCNNCGEIITEQNVSHIKCDEDCEICEYCSDMKCPNCGTHVCCGGCV